MIGLALHKSIKRCTLNYELRTIYLSQTQYFAQNGINFQTHSVAEC